MNPTITRQMPRGYAVFKLAVFGLLTLNAVHYALDGGPGTALDSCAWLLLLALFELEARGGKRLQARALLIAVHFARLVAATAIVAAGASYVMAGAWLDVINTVLWLGVVALLEFQLRQPGAVARWRGMFVGGAATLYLSLGVMVALWAGSGEWFDAYDAALWLIAFATIEMDVLRFVRQPVP